MPHPKPELELALYLGAVMLVTVVAAGAGIFDNVAGDYLPHLALSALLLTVCLGVSFLRRTYLYQRANDARRRAEIELHKLSLAVQQSPAAVAIIDMRGVIEYVNHKMCDASGYERDDMVGRKITELIGQRLPQAAFAEMAAAIQRRDIWQGELALLRKQGGQFHAAATISAIVDQAGGATHVLATLEDISDRIAYREHLFQQANFDQLTGLPNRSLALDRLAQAINSAERHQRALTLLLVDLDRFKMVNDTLGHRYGDALLLEASQRLLQCVRDEDTVARLGSDEFLILLVNQRAVTDATLAANKVIEVIARPFTIEGRELNITASVGLTVYPDDGTTAAELLRNADAAMHMAKQQGQNTYHYYTPEMNRRALERLNLETHLRHAVQRNELELYYQPLIGLETGEVIGMEALLRWHNAELGNPGPDQFIPVAEESGLIIPIGQWLLNQACHQAAQWQREGHTWRVAVNISTRQFVGNSVVHAVEKALGSSGLAPELLELEITEGLLLNDAPQTRRALDRLKRIGVRLSLDDFGTGYSSLSYLKRYHFDVLKIDRSFINEVETKRSAAELVKAIIAMAHSLGLEVIGEGVEATRQAQFIQRRGCDIAQGYLFSRPLPAAQLADWLRGYSRGGNKPAALEARH